MKINPNLKTIHPDSKPVGRMGDLENSTAEFDAILTSSKIENRHQACTVLLKKIDEQGLVLKKSPSIERMNRYRQLVKEFMAEALGDAYTVDSSVNWDRSGNRREFVIVKKVNQSLEELMDSLVHQEKSQIDLVARMDEIRGWLLDLYC